MLSCVINCYDELVVLVLYHVMMGYTHDFRTWVSQTGDSPRSGCEESIVNNTIEAQALPFVINEISELNTQKTTVPGSQEN